MWEYLEQYCIGRTYTVFHFTGAQVTVEMRVRSDESLHNFSKLQFCDTLRSTLVKLMIVTVPPGDLGLNLLFNAGSGSGSRPALI